MEWNVDGEGMMEKEEGGSLCQSQETRHESNSRGDNEDRREWRGKRSPKNIRSGGGWNLFVETLCNSVPTLVEE